MVRSEAVDPRDISWEVDRPVHRVYFWWQPQPGPDVMWHCDERRLHDVGGVDEILQWAQEHAGGRDFVVYAETVNGEALGLLRLFGEDPQAASSATGPSQVASASG